MFTFLVIWFFLNGTSAVSSKNWKGKFEFYLKISFHYWHTRTRPNIYKFNFIDWLHADGVMLFQFSLNMKTIILSGTEKSWILWQNLFNYFLCKIIKVTCWPNSWLIEVIQHDLRQNINIFMSTDDNVRRHIEILEYDRLGDRSQEFIYENCSHFFTFKCLKFARKKYFNANENW